MTALTKNVNRVYELKNMNTLPVAANVRIFKGAALGWASGYIRPLVAGDVFAGFAQREANNLGGAAGAIDVEIESDYRIALDVGGITGTANLPALVYASDDNTFTTTSSGNSLIGKAMRYQDGKTIVHYNATPTS